MSAEVLSLQAARAEKSARFLAEVEAMIAQSSETIIEWVFKSGEERAQLADYLASEISIRYQPIAKQLSNAMHDHLVLVLAGAQERGEDFSIAIFRALALMFHDLRYTKLAGHVIREQSIAQLDPDAANAVRAKCPSPVDTACRSLFEHYQGLRKK